MLSPLKEAPFGTVWQEQKIIDVVCVRFLFHLANEKFISAVSFVGFVLTHWTRTIKIFFQTNPLPQNDIIRLSL
jgi:hypothetical protein